MFYTQLLDSKLQNGLKVCQEKGSFWRIDKINLKI